MTADRQPLPSHAEDVLHRLAAALKVERFRLFGGAALDLLNNPAYKCHDLDVALAMSQLESFHPRRDVAVDRNVRPYWIRLNIPVVMVGARHRELELDLNFLDEPGRIGHFDVETVAWDYPDLTFADPFNVVGKRLRSFHLVTDPNSDNPLLLLNRVLKMSVKYNVRFWRQPHLLKLVDRLVQAARDWQMDSEFHGPVAHEAHLRAVASCVRRAQQKIGFLGGCAQAGVFDARLSPLANALNRDPSLAVRLAAVDSDHYFWRLADDAVAFGSSAWRQYRREVQCG